MGIRGRRMKIETNQQAIDRYYGTNSSKSYTDEYGRFELYPRAKSKVGKYSSENPKTFQGYMDIVLDHAEELTDSRVQTTVDAILMTQVEPGLFGRQVPGKNFGNTVSHDEYNGICYTASVVPELRDTVCNEIVEYGMENGWLYNDEIPNLTPWQAIKQKEFKQLAFIRQPRDRAFYKIMSTKYNPNLLEVLWLFVSTLVTVHRPAFHKDCGTKLIMFFRMLAIERVTDKWYYKLMNEYVRKQLEKTYGKEYLPKMLRAYFKDANHPIHVLAQGLR
jgi:hypothetical protein